MHGPHSSHEPLQEGKRGLSSASVFIARNRFAVLDKSSNQIVIKDLGNEVRTRAAAVVWGMCSQPGMASSAARRGITKQFALGIWRSTCCAQ